MIDPARQTDVQWARAFGAVLVAFLVLCGVVCAGGPARLARETEPVTRVAAALYCMAAAALDAGRASPGACPGRGC
jgi:hypothetical protein